MMRLFCSIGLVSFALAIASCARPHAVAPRARCPSAWTAQFNVDSTIALCAPPGFRLGFNSSTLAQWASGTLGPSGISSLSIRLVPASADTLAGPWPRRLAPPPDCGPSCWTVDTVAQVQDSLMGRPVLVEQGRVSGGAARFLQQPVFWASWEPAPGWRADAQGTANAMAGLDTLRRMLRTVSIATSPP